MDDYDYISEQSLISDEAITAIQENFAMHYLFTLPDLNMAGVKDDDFDEALLELELKVFKGIRKCPVDTIKERVESFGDLNKKNAIAYDKQVTTKCDAVLTDWCNLIYVREYLVLDHEMERWGFMNLLYDIMEYIEMRPYDKTLQQEKNAFDKQFPKTWNDDAPEKDLLLHAELILNRVLSNTGSDK